MDAEREPLLVVRDLKTYFMQDEGIVKAVDGVSFEVQPRATLGIVGESGCGKSITARSILRIVDRPGRILEGEILFRRPGSNGGAAAVVDLARLDPNGAEMRAIRGAEIALIFQEPMSSFSPVHTIGNQISEAIMLITHDLGVIAEMATDVAVMYLGRVVEQAPVDAIFHAPRHPYTRALLRSIPRMRARSRERLAPIAGAIPHPYDRPTGCPFHPRCTDFMPGKCDREAPPLRRVDDQHAVSCFLYE